MSEKITMFELLNERLTEEEIIKLTLSYDNKFSELEKENILLKNQLQQKESIIKEVREYIESNPLVYMYDTDVYVTDIEFLEGEIPELKFFRTLNEILDKGE